MNQKRIRDCGVVIGSMTPGPFNKITDVPGVRVGHTTLHTECYHTGVTVILPTEDSVFLNKPVAACFVHNGFGKTAGLMQIEELGTLETPIALTGTLNVGKVSDALVSYTLDDCKKHGRRIRSLNPVVGECNDGLLSRIADRPMEEKDVLSAIESACVDFAEGDVGAGAGTICYGMKGGIGSASRCIPIGDQIYTLGVLVQSNYGATKDLVIEGDPVGERILAERERRKSAVTDPYMAVKDQGSIMMVVATDLPLSSRQLKRVIRRCGVGLARIGSFTGHGSGEVMIGFTTANRIPYDECVDLLSFCMLPEDLLDRAFRAAAEATEEAVLNSMITAHTCVSESKTVETLSLYYPEIQ